MVWGGILEGSTDHPRKNGEHTTFRISRAMSSGSPPQKRGTLGPAFVYRRALRITPAKTGNTVRAVARHEWLTDHPRKNGEHNAR